MNTQKTQFLPQVHGFKFENSFSLSSTVLGLDDDKPVGNFGLCGGMCFAVLDRFFSARQVEIITDAPNITDPLFDELLNRQLNTLAIAGWKKIYDWQSSPDMSHWYRKHSVGYRTKKEWPAIKESLDSGIPITLCLIRVEGYAADPTDNHQVLAYHYEEDDENIIIWVYDPNHPGDPQFIRVNFNLPQNNIDGRYSSATKERLRGFFAIKYDRQEIVARVRSPKIDTCEFVNAEADIRDGSPVRRNDFLLRFSWNANFIPYYTITLDGWLYTGPVQDGPDITYEFQPLASEGTHELLVVTYGSQTRVLKLQIADTFEGQRLLTPPPPELTGAAYLHSPESANPEKAIISDAKEETNDVEVVEDNLPQETIEALSDRTILVQGIPEGSRDDPWSVIAALRTDFKLGYITKKVFCKISYEWLFDPVIFHYRIFRGQINENGSTTITDPGQESPLPQDHLDQIQLLDNFTQDDYDQDVFVGLNLRADDRAAQHVRDELVIYARSLLVFTTPVYSSLTQGAEFEYIAERIHEYVDREFLKEVIKAERLPMDQQTLIIREYEDFISKFATAIPRVWNRVSQDKRFIGKLKKTRLKTYKDYSTKVTEVPKTVDSIAKFKDHVDTVADQWIKVETCNMTRLCFKAIFDHLHKTGELNRIIDSLS